MKTSLLVIMVLAAATTCVAADNLFPANLEAGRYVQFNAEGFSVPVTGVIYRNGTPGANGVPLGGVATGCLDLDLGGTFGYSTVFNTFVPRRGPFNLPFLGMSIGKRVWVLSSYGIPGAAIKGMSYWGHYPIADLQYETDSPVKASLRAWAPFLPGDTPNSTIPGAVFEVHLRNTTTRTQKGALAFSFPGFDRVDCRQAPIERKPIKNELINGIIASASDLRFCLAAIGNERVRIGRGLGLNADAWMKIGSELPTYESQDHDGSSCSVAVDFSLAPKGSKVVRFVLSWYAPKWGTNGSAYSGGKSYDQMYATRYHSELEAANTLAKDHELLLTRILAWQQVIYSEKTLPGWLQDSLVNVLHLITETALWSKKGDQTWCRDEDGIFGMNECPRACPQMECIPCSFYGNLPVVYFFPDAALSQLRAEKAYQYPDGRPAWIFGAPSGLSEPDKGYQFVLNGSCLVELIDKMLMRENDDVLLKEFYDSAKKATVYTMTLRPDYGDKQVVSMPVGNEGGEWYESVPIYGLVSHIGGIHLAHLRMMKRMAERMGDAEFAKQCDNWLAAGSKALEDNLWTGKHYLFYNEPETGKKLDVVLGYELDGQWMARFHGLPGVFQADRVQTTLETLKKCNANPKLAPYGPLVFCKPEGTKASEFPCGYWTDSGSHAPGDMILGMTYMYEADRVFGLDIVRRVMGNLVTRIGGAWDSPILVRGDTGARMYGNDYYQNMMLWSLPAALAGQDLSGPTKQGGLVDRVIKAARG